MGTRWPDKLQMCPNILPARPIEKSGVEVILIKCLTGSMLRIRPIYVPPPFTLGVVMLILQTSQMPGKMILKVFSHILCSKDPGSLFWPQLKSRISSFQLAGWPETSSGILFIKRQGLLILTVVDIMVTLLCLPTEKWNVTLCRPGSQRGGILRLHHHRHRQQGEVVVDYEVIWGWVNL